MTTIHGFELLREQEIPEINTKARLFRHQRTGAQLLSLENDDENKSFGITFPTPPSDSTGLPHIMEHSVLGGSRKYPVKEPFVELIKGSLNTFVNAMTYPDKTTYPFASQNTQDFYNLLDVYLDAVFYPRITPEHLQQEGWHYELENPDDPLIYKGIVFNEMKGNYSSPDNMLGEYTQRSLFPDNVYCYDSGGDPEAIPDLTYEDFREFHSKYYHPSNSLIWFWGDDDPNERLRRIDEFIAEFKARPVDTTIALQPKMEQPRRFVHPYIAGEDENAKKGMTVVNWLLPEATDAQAALAFAILEYVLIGTPASPLRKALIDSGLGENLAGRGLADEYRQMIFSTGLKGIAVEDADKVESLILDTLKQLASNGIEADMVEAAMNTIEFRLREYNTGQFPRGLAMMLDTLNGWLHGADPFSRLAFEGHLNAIKAKVRAGRFFEGLIQQHFLDNTHRATVILKPDTELQAQQDAAEKAKLAKVKSSLNAEQIQAIIADTRKLKALQEATDSEEALATIPGLKLGDLDKQNKRIPIAVLEKEGAQVLYHDIFTNGVLYLDLGFNLHTLPQEYLPFVPLFGRALLEMGTEKEDFVKLSQRIGRKTGGIAPARFTSSLRTKQEGAAWIFLRGKATPANADELLAILRDVLLTVKLDNKERFRQIVLQEKARLESGLVPGGSQVVYTRLNARFTEAGWANEQMGGVTYLFFVRELAEQIEKDWPGVLAKLEAVRKHLLNRSTMLANVTLDNDNWKAFEPKLGSFISGLPGSGVQPAKWTRADGTANEGLTIPAKVNYVGKAANLYQYGYKLHGSFMPIHNYLRTTYLWEKIRVQGGAYGGFCNFDQHSGVFAYLSYRDPNLTGTLDNYEGAGKFLKTLDISEEEVTRAIIGAIGDMDAYLLPDAKGYASMTHYLIGYTPEQRQQIRDEILSTTARDFKAFGEVLESMNQAGQVVVMGSQEAIESANASRGNLLRQVTKVL